MNLKYKIHFFLSACCTYLSNTNIIWCCADEQCAEEEWFNHNVKLLCLSTVAPSLSQPKGIEENGFEMGDHPLEPPETSVFGLYANNLNSKTNCRLSPDDFPSKRSDSSSKPGNKQQSSHLAGVESPVRINKQIPKSNWWQEPWGKDAACVTQKYVIFPKARRGERCFEH